MMEALEPSAELESLLAAALDQRLTDADRSRFEQLLNESEAARECYVEHVVLHAMLRWEHAPALGEVPVASTRHEERESGREGEGEIFGFDLSPRLPVSHSSGLPLSSLFSLNTPLGNVAFSYAVSAVLVCIGLWIFSLMSASSPRDAVVINNHADSQNRTASHAPAPELKLVSIARITGMVDCHWVNDSEAPFQNKIKLHDKFALKSGLLEITYHTGAKVILQGPCTYEVESADGGFLSLGKLTARVEKKAEGGRRKVEVANLPSPFGRGAGGEGSVKSPSQSALTLTLSQRARGPDNSPFPLPPSPLFAVRTPTAVVTDLGTEFGVEVKNDETISHVFRGSVRLVAIGTNGQPVGQSVVLRDRESARLHKPIGNSPGDIVRLVGHADSGKFVRRMISELDLLDIVAGGNGTGRRRERGIDPTTGFEDPVFVPNGRIDHDATYHKSLYNPLIDGVFVPRGGEVAVQLDSAGHTYQLPVTSREAYGSIWSRGAKVDHQPAAIAKDKRYWIYLMDNPERYMPKGAGMLCIHANAGITFSLKAMRHMVPAMLPVRFRATAGVAASPTLFPGVHPLVNIWVFVDGRLAVKRENLKPEDDPFRVDVSLTPNDQFLSLVVTNGGANNHCDWVVFGDPIVKLDLKSEEPVEQK